MSLRRFPRVSRPPSMGTSSEMVWPSGSAAVSPHCTLWICSVLVTVSSVVAGVLRSPVVGDHRAFFLLECSLLGRALFLLKLVPVCFLSPCSS